MKKKRREREKKRRRDEKIVFENSDKSFSIHFDINYAEKIND